VDVNDVIDAIKDRIGQHGEAETRDVLREIRQDIGRYLPADQTENTFKGALKQLTADNYALRSEGYYYDTLGKRDIFDVTVIPTLSDTDEARLLEYISDKEEKDTFNLSDAQQEVVPGASEAAVRTFLLRNLGEEIEPKLVIASNGSDDPSDYFPGAGFRVPTIGEWKINETYDDPSTLRDAIGEAVERNDGGTLKTGRVAFNSREKLLSSELDEAAAYDEQYVELTLEAGQSHEQLERLFERLPDDASEINVLVEFE